MTVHYRVLFLASLARLCLTYFLQIRGTFQLYRTFLIFIAMFQVKPSTNKSLLLSSLPTPQLILLKRHVVSLIWPLLWILKNISVYQLSRLAKKEALGFVKDIIIKKIQSWKHSALLSRVVKSWLKLWPRLSLLIQWTAFFFQDIDSLITRFWWGQQDNENKIHWCNWSTVSAPKSSGGLGFWSLHDFNIALLAKQFWRIINNPIGFWVRILHGHYFPNRDALNVSKGSSALWAWSSLLNGRDLIVDGGCWQVGG